MPTTSSRRVRQQTQGQTAVVFCDTCGNSVESDCDGETAIHVDDHYYCCDTCAEADDYMACSYDGCGIYHSVDSPSAVNIGERSFCSEVCAHAAGFTKCAQCGDWTHVDSETHVVAYNENCHDEQTHFCSVSCADANECESCHSWFINLQRHTSTGRICVSCATRRYEYCERCGRYSEYDEWDDDEGCCVHCCENGNEADPLHRYGYWPPIQFYGDTHGNNAPYLGVELETDLDYDDEEARRTRTSYCHALRALEGKDRFWLTRDGSLDCGVEVTSMPMTLDEHIGSGVWEDIRETALEHGFSSHNNGRCGLHIHVNRDYFGKSEKRQHAGGYNLAMLVSRFERQMTRFTRRKENGWCQYGLHAEFIDKANTETQSMNMFQKSDRMCERNSYAHAQCVNFEHGATFELRIFRGTLRLMTLYASLAMAQGLARAAKKHSQVWCESVDWYTLMDDIASHTENDIARAAFTEYLAERGVA